MRQTDMNEAAWLSPADRHTTFLGIAYKHQLLPKHYANNSFNTNKQLSNLTMQHSISAAGWRTTV